MTGRGGRVLCSHGSDFDIWHDRLPRPLRAVIRATLHRATVVVALGDRWADRLRAIAPRASVVTVPDAVRVPSDHPDAPVAGPRQPVSDVVVRQQLGAAARERALDRFDHNVIRRRFDALYRQVSRR